MSTIAIILKYKYIKINMSYENVHNVIFQNK